MALSQIKFQTALRNVTEQQRKVFDAIPIGECWSFKQIHGEITRRGMQMRWDQFQGCVNALREAGIVREPAPGMFKREPVRAAEVTESISMAAAPAPTPIITKPAAAKPSATDQLAALGARLRTMADNAIHLHHEAVKVAEAVDNIALDIEENGEAAQKAMQQLATLKALFKD